LQGCPRFLHSRSRDSGSDSTPPASNVALSTACSRALLLRQSFDGGALPIGERAGVPWLANRKRKNMITPHKSAWHRLPLRLQWGRGVRADGKPEYRNTGRPCAEP